MDKFQTLREKTNPSNNVYPNIQTQNIPDGGVSTAKIADDAVTTAKIGVEEVTASNIAPNAVTSVKIANNAVTSDKIGTSAVTSTKIASQAVTTAKIASESVNSMKLANGAVTTAKIADGAVTAQKIASGVIAQANTNEYWFSDTDLTTIIGFIQWIEYQLKHNRRPLYDDTVYMSTIDCVSTDNQEVTLKCSMPLQGINSTTTISTDADVENFYNTHAGSCLVFVGA